MIGTIIALDVGDVWTGVAKADRSGMIAKPYETVMRADLHGMLRALHQKNPLHTIVVGKPITLRFTESDQTKKVIALADELKLLFPEITIVLWDERLSSKHADSLQKGHSKEEKRKSHAIAAAFILQGYLDFLAQQKSTTY